MSRRGRWVKCSIRKEVLSDKARHWKVARDMNKKSATGIEDEAVTQKKSSELPKQDLEGSEVQ